MARYIWLLLIPIGFLTFHNLSNAGWVGDDYDQVVFNQLIKNLDHPFKFFTGSTFYSGGAEELRGTYYKPVMTATFALIYGAFGPSPFWFHMIAVALHILNAILLFFFLKNLFPPWLSWIGATIFLVHPSHSEVVQYVSNYQDVLYMTFGLAALNVRTGWLMALCLALSALSKETGLLFIPILAAYHGWIHRKIPWVVLGSVVAVYAYLRIYVSNVSGLQAYYTPMETASTLTRLGNVPAAVFYYLKQFFYPWPLGLAQHWIYREFSFTGHVIPLIGIAAAIAFAMFTIKKFGAPAKFFTLVCVFSLGLHSQLIPLDATVADRWHYLPSIGMLGLILLWAGKLWQTQAKAIAIGSGVVIAIFAFWTYERNLDWQNEEKLLARDLQYQTDSFALMSQLGFIMLNQNRTDEACPLLKRSVELAPNWWINSNNLGVCLFQKGDLPGAMVQFQNSIITGNYHLAYENYAKGLIRLGRRTEAIQFIDQALQRFPGNPNLPQLMAIARSASK